ncbi:MAG: ShlB/FhaC/HecB family hemolysin secretion/activation protein [Magnetococcales bacterium]|nr:ShlB/FhaC/HecB family hemolysin secretion/activation protein [Magnetococcales bacterium]
MNIKKSSFLPYVVLICSQSAYAASLPGAGGQMQQIPPVPIPKIAAPGIAVAPNPIPVMPESKGIKILVHRVNVTGSHVYSAADLLQVSGFESGREWTLSELQEMATKITDYYHRNGYFVAQAYLPAQDIQDNTVTIAVLEGRYGKITLKNQTNLSDDLANSLLAGLNPGDVVASAPLENHLLPLADLPGVKVESSLIPGASEGTTDLLVDVTPGQRVTGSFDADNAGNRYTGAYRMGTTVNLNNPTGHGDIATLRAITAGSGLYYGRVSYQIQFVKTKVGVAYSALDYHLGKNYDSLEANGTAQIVSLYADHPLIRTRDNNLNSQISYDHKLFRDKVDTTSTVTDKEVDVVMGSLYGDHTDMFGGGGLSSYSVNWSLGNFDLQTPVEQRMDVSTAHSNGGYQKLGLKVTRLQKVTETLSLYGSLIGQIASKNLSLSEKMELGGMYGVRAYPEGEGDGDEGYIANLEARLLLPKWIEAMPGQQYVIGFVDTGTIRANKHPWNNTPNSRTLSGGGMGLNWMANNNLTLNAYYAHKLGNAVVTSGPDAAGQYWIQVVHFF